MAKKSAVIEEPKTIDEIAEIVKPVGPLTVDELQKFLISRNAERCQIIRVTGHGSLNTSIVPQDLGNFILVIEINPNKGVIV